MIQDGLLLLLLMLSITWKQQVPPAGYFSSRLLTTAPLVKGLHKKEQAHFMDSQKNMFNKNN